MLSKFPERILTKQVHVIWNGEMLQWEWIGERQLQNVQIELFWYRLYDVFIQSKIMWFSVPYWTVTCQIIAYTSIDITWSSPYPGCNNRLNKKHWSVPAHPALCGIMMSCSDVIWRHDVFPWRHVMSWHHTIGQDLIFVHSNQKILKMMFFWHSDLSHWPMTLTSKLVWDIINVNTCIKFRDHMSNGLAVRTPTNRHTHTLTNTNTLRHTNGSFSITSTTDAGGKNGIYDKPNIMLVWEILRMVI